MSSEFERHRREEISRKRRIRRLLRPLPRRANLARYPVIKWFRDIARKAPFLWSFKRQYVVPAIYGGAVLAFLPLFGFQLLIAFGVALALRANLMITVALQFITNPVTILPVYGFTGWIGVKLMNVVGVGAELGAGLKVANGLFVGGLAVGLSLALLMHIAYLVLLWEAQRFKAHGQKLRQLLHLPSAPAAEQTALPAIEASGDAAVTPTDRPRLRD